MKITPIIFSGEMIRALLDGRKTQTRRIIKTLPNNRVEIKIDGKWRQLHVTDLPEFLPYSCRYGGPGDLLWARETWADANSDAGPCICYRADNNRRYLSDDACPVEYERYPGFRGIQWASDLEGGIEGSWRSPIHMYQWASRLTLELTDVRVERLQDISEADAEAEGIESIGGPTSGQPWKDYGREQKYKFFSAPSASFRSLWESISGAGSWDVNPWVWVLGFKVHKMNIDQLLKQRAAV